MARVLVETLKLTRNAETVKLNSVAVKARVSQETVVNVLSDILQTVDHPLVRISRRDHFRIAMLAAESGWLDSTAVGLSWQEFEQFAEECLRLAGFETKRNVRVKDQKRFWQIDVVGTRSRLVLSIDCKHWKPPNYPSKFKQASAHQKTATTKLLSQKEHGTENVIGLPVILTLHDPHLDIVDGTVMLPIRKLPDFLSNITPFAQGLPFLYGGTDKMENPIKAASLTLGD